MLQYTTAYPSISDIGIPNEHLYAPVWRKFENNIVVKLDDISHCLKTGKNKTTWHACEMVSSNLNYTVYA